MAGIIVGWDGTIANIPTDWYLCNGGSGTPNFLNKYLKSVGASEDPGTTGGATTHTHVSPTHTHTQDSHSHDNSLDSSTQSSTQNYRGASSGDAAPQHIHTVTIGAGTATNQTTSVTLASTSTDPPYYKLAFIYDSLTSRFPVGSIILWNSTSYPNGWVICDGAGGTPDLRDKFSKSVGSAEDPGGTGGSSNSHTHTNSSHNHTQDAHSHSASHNSPSGVNYFAGAYSVSSNTHTHSITIESIVATNQSSTVTIDSGDGQPAYYKLLFIKNTGSVSNRPKNGIVIWTGTIANIPSGYNLCDGTNGTPDLRNNFIKGATSSAQLGNTGGSATHNHTVQSHNHTQDTHEHGNTFGGASGTITLATEPGSPVALANHTHTLSNLTTVVATNQTTSITINSSNGEPEYYEVAFIMQTVELDVGSYSFIS